jgi:hypothetical protein
MTEKSFAVYNEIVVADTKAEDTSVDGFLTEKTTLYRAFWSNLLAVMRGAVSSSTNR